jgi:hypothetical protein
MQNGSCSSEEEVLAACDLDINRPGGEYCVLTNKRVIINRDGESKSFPLSPSLGLSLVYTNSWRYLFSGISFLLMTFIFVFETDIHKLLLSNIALAGFILIYISWIKKLQLRISEQSNHIYIPVSNRNELKTFIRSVERHKKHYYHTPITVRH